MGLTATDYQSALTQSLPPSSSLGANLWAGPNVQALLLALADSLARAGLSAEGLLDEADPRTTSLLLGDWERLAGLPDPALGGAWQSIQERRAWLVSRLTWQGGQSKAYYIGLAARLGVTITITEFTPWGCGLGQCGRDMIGSDTMNLLWQVNMPAPPVYYFQIGLSMCGEPLGYAQTGIIEALFARIKSAHTTLIFNYGGTA